MAYDALRNYTDEPSLAQMTVKAIEVLDRKDSNGYLLVVEGGRIDHAHHQNFAKLALHEVLGLEKAVLAAMERSGDETMIIVTADHSHSVTFSGYPERGTDILGEFVTRWLTYFCTKDFFSYIGFGNKVNIEPYETISYANGPGFNEHRSIAAGARYNTWRKVEEMDRSSPIYRHLATFPLVDETHGGNFLEIFSV